MQIIKKSSFISLALLAVMLTGCAPHVTEVPLTQLQIRELQTKEFETNNTKLVMKSMINVLQDEGFIVKNAVVEMGLLSAEKTVSVENKNDVFFAQLADGPNARWNKQEIIEASANVSEFGQKTRVRMNFQRKTLDNFGCPKDVVTLQDELYYQSFFEKVSKGIFIQEQEI